MAFVRFTSMPSSPQCPHSDIDTHPRQPTIPSRCPPRYLRYGIYRTHKSMSMLRDSQPRPARPWTRQNTPNAPQTAPPPAAWRPGIKAPQEDASLRRRSVKRP